MSTGHGSNQKRAIAMAAGALLVLLMLWGALTATAQSEPARGVDSPSLADTEGVAASVTLTVTWSYTYYFPIALRDYATPVWIFLGLDGLPIKQVITAGHDPETIYVVLEPVSVPTATALYKSSDGGATWQPSAEGVAGHVQSLFAHPVTPTMLLAGTLMGDGVYYSYDGGEHWTPSPMYPFVRAVAAHPTTPTLWLAASYNPLIFGAAFVHRSEDAGVTWQTATPQGLIVNTFVFDPGDLNRVYACSDGVEYSDDTGMTWHQITLSSCNDLAIHPYTNTILYAATVSGLFKTENRGMTWTNVLTDSQAQYPSITVVKVDLMNPVVVYAVNPYALFRSTDAGHSWQRISAPAGVAFSCIHDLAVGHSGVLYVGTDRGVWAVLFD